MSDQQTKAPEEAQAAGAAAAPAPAAAGGEAAAAGAVRKKKGKKNVANGRLNSLATARNSVTEGFDFRLSQASTSASTRSDNSWTVNPDSEIAQRSTSGLMVSVAMAGS